ncbi:hypothetical protein FXO38_30140 [Capsicum annuum]|nr:hypothetical protein FXO38_30140 [Capsicum annuum]
MEYQDRRFGSGSLLKKPDRRKSSSLDLNNVVINICHSSSPHFGVMKKTPITTSRVGTFPSPRTPHYHHSIVGIQKGCHCIQLLIGGRAVNGGNLLANSSFSIGVMTNDGLSIQCGGNLGSGNFHVLTQLHGKVSAFLTVYFAPTTSGPRVSKINAYINGVDTPIMLGATTLFVKIIGSIGAISTGIDLGKGEPLIYFGSSWNICKSGSCGLFGRGGLIMFDVSGLTVIVVDIIPVVIIGVIGALLWCLLNHVLHKVLGLYNFINEVLSWHWRERSLQTIQLPKWLLQ